MDERRKQQLMEGCMRIRKEIAAWLLMALWVIFSVKIAEVLLGESLPGWVEIGGMILCGDPCGIYLEPYLCLAGMEGRIRSGIIRRRLWRIFRMCS